MNNDFDPFPFTLGEKKNNAQYTNSDYGNVNRHKHTALVRVQSLEKV